MRRLVTARPVTVLLVTVILVLVLAPPAGAARTPRQPTGGATIAAVTAPELVTVGTDDYGSYCLYQADVTMSWKGTTRLWVSQLVDGMRQAPAEVRLTGSGKNVTFTVTGIPVRAGTTGYLVAEAQVLDNLTWVVIASKASRELVSC